MSTKTVKTLQPFTHSLLRTLLLIAAVIVALSGLLYFVMVQQDFAYNPLHWIWQQVDVGLENNLAAWYGAFLWSLLGLSSILVGRLAPRLRAGWYTLAAISFYAAVDEIAMLHEQLYLIGSYIRLALPFDVFSYDWVIAGLVLVLIVGLLLTPLLLRLPRPILLGYAVAATVFLTAAVVIETIGGHIEAHFGGVTWHLMIAIHLEEFLEYCGVIIAVCTTVQMLSISREADSYRVSFAGYRERGRTQIS